MEWTEWQLKWTVNRQQVEAMEAAGHTAEVIAVMVTPDALRSEDLVLHPKLDDTLRDFSRRGAFDASTGKTMMLPSSGLLSEKYVLYAVCPMEPASTKNVRIAAGGIGRALAELKACEVKWRVPAALTAGLDTAEAASACAEGLMLGSYSRQTSARKRRPALRLDVRFELEREDQAKTWDQGFERGARNAEAVCYARELTNIPSNRLTPAALADEAASLAERYGLECRIYDESEAAAEGMGGLLAVGKGSVNPPRMIVLRHNGNPGSDRCVGLIGKGVTFDTGGINLKPAHGMEEFISDMGGAAAVFGVMRGAAAHNMPVNVVAVIPAAENMPSGSAFKPGDVITTYSGLTVEVLNTDAEGRIVLADGLTTAIRAGADRLIDVATLTGAVMHALGDVTTGAVANDESLLQDVILASERAAEYVWPLPSHPEYRKMLTSPVADLKNHGGTWGGAIAGGLFIGAFAEELPWVHLDIGGTAWMWEDRDLEPKGGTGVMVRTLLEYLREQAEIAP